MGGNDKADASLARTWNARKDEAFSATPNKPGQIGPALTFYDISRGGLHLWGTGKSWV
jgi:hypothetical protein